MKKYIKYVIIILFFFSTFFILKNNNLLKKTYKDLYNKTPYENAVSTGCHFSQGKKVIYASECIKISSLEWHIKPCGMEYWCSVKNQNMIPTKDSACKNTEFPVLISKLLMRKYYYNSEYSSVVNNCL